MPARVMSLTLRVSRAPRSSTAARISRAVTSSQRQTSVSSVSQPGQPGPGAWAATMVSANARIRARRRRSAPVTAGAPFNPVAMARAASSPSVRASCAPPMPLVSPAAHTPGTEVAWSPSSASANVPSPLRTVAQPRAVASSIRGTRPCPTARASQSIRRSVPGSGRQSRPRRETVTASRRSAPCASVTALPVRIRTPWRSSAAPWVTASLSLPGLVARARGRRA